MKKRKRKTVIEKRVSINLSKSVYKKLAKQKLDYEFGTWDKFMLAISKILRQFKPEMEDLK
jgi:hypothetical protein